MCGADANQMATHRSNQLLRRVKELLDLGPQPALLHAIGDPLLHLQREHGRLDVICARGVVPGMFPVVLDLDLIFPAQLPSVEARRASRLHRWELAIRPALRRRQLFVALVLVLARVPADALLRPVVLRRAATLWRVLGALSTSGSSFCRRIQYGAPRTALDSRAAVRLSRDPFIATCAPFC